MSDHDDYKLDRLDGESLRCRALDLAREGRPAEAVEAFRALVRRRPGDAAAVGDLGVALTLAGQAAEAEDCFRQAMDLAPAEPAFALNLGKLLLGTGRPGEAAAPLERALSLSRPEGRAEAEGLLAQARAASGTEPTGAADDSPVPAACFSPDLAARCRANLEEGGRLLAGGAQKEGLVFLERAWSQAGRGDPQVMVPLTQALEGAGDHDRLARVWREFGLEAAVRGAFELMLVAFGERYYAAYKATGSYGSLAGDPVVDAALRLAAPRVEFTPFLEDLPARLDPAKLRLALAMDVYQGGSAVIKRFLAMARHLDKSRFEILVLWRAAPPAEGRWLVGEFQKAGCHTLWPPDERFYPAVQRFGWLLQKAGCHFLMANTPFLTPWLDLLMKCRPARFNLKFLTQGGGGESGMDYVIVPEPELLIDEAAPGFAMGPAYVDMPPARRPPEAPNGRLKAVCLGRPVMFRGQALSAALAEVLKRLPFLELTVLGPTPAEAPELAAAPRCRVLGFVDQVPRRLTAFDVLIDTWPLGGGSSLREAHAAGLPVISYRTPWREPYRPGASFHGGLDRYVHPELLLPRPGAGPLAEALTRLWEDPEFYLKVLEDLAAQEVLSPAQSVARLGRFLEDLAASAAS